MFPLQLQILESYFPQESQFSLKEGRDKRCSEPKFKVKLCNIRARILLNINVGIGKANRFDKDNSQSIHETGLNYFRTKTDHKVVCYRVVLILFYCTGSLLALLKPSGVFFPKASTR